MAVTLTLTTAKLSSMSIPSLAQAAVSYVLGYKDSTGVYRDVMVDNAPTVVPMALTGASAIPAAEGIVQLIAQDCQTRYGSMPTTVHINGTDYPVHAPPPSPAKSRTRS